MAGRSRWESDTLLEEIEGGDEGEAIFSRRGIAALI
jgi:hypothetical protein